MTCKDKGSVAKTTLFEILNFNMEANIKPVSFPYVARTYWFFRWGLLLTYLFIMAGLAVNYPETLNSLSQTSWFVILAFVSMFLIGIPLVITSMFFSKTVFEENYIERTNQFLIKRKWFYEDIKKVETSNTGHIRITFLDRNSIKVWSGEADLNYVLCLLEPKIHEEVKNLTN